MTTAPSSSANFTVLYPRPPPSPYRGPAFNTANFSSKLRSMKGKSASTGSRISETNDVTTVVKAAASLYRKQAKLKKNVLVRTYERELKDALARMD